MMRSNLRAACAVVVGLSALAGRAGAQGPTGTYYLTAGDQGTNWIIQGTTATPFADNQPGLGGEYAIAVTSTVQTLGNGNPFDKGLGAQYTLGGVFTGTNYAYPAVTASFFDGTTDGAHNYSVNFLTGLVYQMNLDWSNPVVLFDTLAGVGGDLGITYDSANNSIWVSGFNNSTVTDFALNGTVLSSFTGPAGELSSLAYDPSDGTLWMGSQAQEGTFWQFSTTGTQLQSQFYAALVGENTLGGEFAINPVPEPSSLALAALGGLALVGIRRRRTRSA
jgi:hypothetical protein